MDAYSTFMAALRTRQTTLDLADGAFAARIGVTRQMWQACRTDRARLGLASIQLVLAAFPDLAPLAMGLLFLPTNAKNGAIEANKPQEAAV